MQVLNKLRSVTIKNNYGFFKNTLWEIYMTSNFVTYFSNSNLNRTLKK